MNTEQSTWYGIAMGFVIGVLFSSIISSLPESFAGVFGAGAFLLFILVIIYKVIKYTSK